jgi:WD40 repeat protein
VSAVPPPLFSPYKGLMPFDDSERDALLFFGREGECEIAIANLIASRLTVLYGPSGVGKSSLLRAGVVHELRAQARRARDERGSPELAVVVYSAWREDAVEGLIGAVADAAGDLLGPDVAAPDPGVGTLADALNEWSKRIGGELYVVLDQFEEYFLYHGGEDGPGSFAVEFPEAVNRADLPVHFLIGMREDALAKLDAFKGRIPNLFGNYLRLDRLDQRAARAAILGPIDHLNQVTGNGSYVVEPVLVGAVVTQVAAGRIEPGLAGRGVVQGTEETERVEAPYLQLVLQRIWEVETAAGSRTLRLATLDRLGGAQRIVEDHLEHSLDGLTPAQKDVAARIFGHLVTPSGTKIAHQLGDLARYAGVDQSELEGVVTALVTERILRPLAGEGEHGRRYEIFHDVLAAAVLAWTTRYESERALEEERSAARRRHRRVVFVMGCALVALAAMTAIAVYALAQRSRARTQARHAHTAAAFALAQEGAARTSAQHARARAKDATALAQLSSDPRRSLQLAVESARLYPTQQAEDVLRQALLASHERAVLQTGGPVTAAVYSPDGRRILVASQDGKARILDAATFRVMHVLPHRAAVTSASYSPGGETIVTTSEDGTARLWNSRTGSLIRTFHHAGPVRSASFGGGLLATASDDRTARIWNLADRRLVQVLQHPGKVSSAVLNPSGTLVATIAEDADGRLKARLFDTRTGRLVWELPEKGVTGVVFSADGRLFVTTSTDHKARIRDLATGRFLYELEHEGHVVGASFSPDGKQLVTASGDGAAYVWDVATGTRQLLLVSPTGPVTSASFSPDGRFIVVSSTDRTARVYDAHNGLPLADLIGHSDGVTGAAFSPDGRSIVTASADGTARLWAPGVEDQLQALPHLPTAKSSVRASFSRDGRLILVTGAGASRVWQRGGHVVSLSSSVGAPFTGSSLSTDGRLAVTIGTDGSTRIWRVASGEQLTVLRGGGRAVAATFSPDGKLVLTWSADHAARLWAVDSGRRVHVLPQGSPVTSTAFSPDGRLVATAGADGSVTLWNVETGARLHELVGHRGPVGHVVFSPNGKLLLTASDDKTARLWSVSSGAPLHTLRAHTKGLTDAEFSRDGRSIVTASRDTNAWIWDTASGRRLHQLLGSFSSLSSASFSPDGRWVIAAGRNRAILFRADTNQFFYLKGHADRDANGHATWLTAASFSPDGRRILTSSGDGTVRLFVCDVCGTRDELISLAQGRLAAGSRRSAGGLSRG